MKIILFFVALALVTALGVPSVVFSLFYLMYAFGLKDGFKAFERMFLKLAISLDQFGNVVCGVPFQLIFTKYEHKDVYLFNDEDETVSYVLAVNQKRGTLTKVGVFMCWLLDFLDPDHMMKAILTQREKDFRSYQRYLKNEFE
jgi:hypothetical protein